MTEPTSLNLKNGSTVSLVSDGKDEPLVGMDRRTFIGGSDIGAILGLNPWKTRHQLWLEKTGRVLPMEGNAHTRRGTRLEDIAAEEFAAAGHGLTIPVQRRVAHPDYPFLRAQIDRRMSLLNTAVEIKCPSLGAFAKIRREGMRADYIAQLQWGVGLGAFSAGAFWVFCADQWTGLHIPVTVAPDLYHLMIEAALEFWQYVQRDVPPPEGLDPNKTITASLSTPGEVTPRTDLPFENAARLLTEAMSVRDEGDALYEEARRQMEEAMGTHGVYEGAGLRLHWKPQAGRTSFDRKRLAVEKPLDREKVLVALSEVAARNYTLADLNTALGDCELDLSKFETRGAPSVPLRVYRLGEDRAPKGGE